MINPLLSGIHSIHIHVHVALSHKILYAYKQHYLCILCIVNILVSLMCKSYLPLILTL